MTLSALYTSSSALDASQEFLNVVGNNLANSNTSGYKSQSVQFATQFSQMLQGASQPNGSNGGTDPVQVGNGVSVAATSTNLTQGTINPTGNPLDLAIQGNGYFVVNSHGQTAYTRDGAFTVDSNNNLVNTATGAVIQRVGTVGEGTATSPAFQVAGNSNITIPNGVTIPGQETQNLNFAGNLNPSASAPIAQVLTIGQALTIGGVAATGSTLLNSLDQTTTPYVAGDKIKISGTSVDGNVVTSSYTITGTATDTVSALLASINQAFQSQTTATGATASLDSAGKIELTANTAGPSSLTLDLVSSGTGVTNLTNFLTTTPGAAGATSTAVTQVYDSQGVAHNVTFSFQKVSNNQWNVSAALNPAEGSIAGFGEDGQVTGLTFNQNGSFNGVLGTSAAESLLTSSPFTVGGAPATGATLLDSLDQHSATPYASPDAITISGLDFAGNTVSTTLPVNATTTLADLVTSINSSFTGALATIDPSGNILLQAKSTGQTPLKLILADAAGNAGTMSFSSLIQTTQGTNGDNNITFKIAGLAGFGASQTIKLSFGSPNGFDGITQAGNTSASSVSVASQDGYSTGSLVSESISSNGTVNGQFSNGKTLAIAQIAVATFANPGSLTQEGNNLLSSNVNTGLPTISAPSTGSAGSIQSSALESSNVDVSTEFTNLIAAQRGYEINAKAFTTANQMLQDTVDLIR